MPNLSIFDHIRSQTSDADKQTLLDLQEFVRRGGAYTYLEIGSHLGGSLQPFIVDELCERIISIDPRPELVTDERAGESFEYAGNSTERMMSLLGQVPGAELEKIETIEKSTGAIDPASINADPALCFIDGEHTNVAALRDALFCSAVAPGSILLFHDRAVVANGIIAFSRVVDGYGHQLPDRMYAIDLRGKRRLDHLLDSVRRPSWAAANLVDRSAELNRAISVGLVWADRLRGRSAPTDVHPE